MFSLFKKQKQITDTKDL